MPPSVICIVGRKNAGKTELTVKLCAELNRRGLKVMTVKHGHGFQLDEPGRDSWRHRHEGGAHRTVVAGPSDFGVLGHWPSREMSLSEIVERFLWDADIVVAEGFKRAPEPKIEVIRGDMDGASLLESGTSAASRIVAVVTDRDGWEAPVPTFSLGSPDLPGALADFLLERASTGEEGP